MKPNWLDWCEYADDFVIVFVMTLNLCMCHQERERETIEEEKAQVDRYKQLLLKQRDIMIALTQRLVERDEQIMSLQDELDAYVSCLS